MVDKDLAFVVLDEIELSPEAWDQQYWAMTDVVAATAPASCGTTFCFAGHLVKHVYPNAWFHFNLPLSLTSNDTRGSRHFSAAEVTVPKVGRHAIWDLARELLGLDEDRAELIFYYGTVLDPEGEKTATLDGLRERVKRVLDEAGE